MSHLGYYRFHVAFKLFFWHACSGGNLCLGKIILLFYILIIAFLYNIVGLFLLYRYAVMSVYV